MKRLATTITASAILLGGLFMSNPAMAQGTRSKTTYQFHLSGDPKLCLVDNGAGQQMAVDTHNCADIVITVTKDYDYFSDWGRCIHTTASHQVKVAFGHCSARNNNDLWYQSHVSPARFRNVNGWLGTKGFAARDKVWAGNASKTNWQLVRV